MPTVIMDLAHPVGRSLAMRSQNEKSAYVCEFQDRGRTIESLAGFTLRRSQIAALRNGHPQIVFLPIGDLYIEPSSIELNWTWRRATTEPFLSKPEIGTLPWSLLDEAINRLSTSAT